MIELMPMKNKPKKSVVATLRLIAKKLEREEVITAAEAMVWAYRKPCTKILVGSPKAQGFGVGTLMILPRKTCIVISKDKEVPFYPKSGLTRRACVEDLFYIGFLPGSLLVDGDYLVRICSGTRIKDEMSLASYTNPWIGWVPKTLRNSTAQTKK